MREVGSFEAKNKLSALLDRVEHGAEIVITRHEKAVARLVPTELGFDRKKAKSAAAGLREASKGVMLHGLKIKDLINKGRRRRPCSLNATGSLCTTLHIWNSRSAANFHSLRWTRI